MPKSLPLKTQNKFITLLIYYILAHPVIDMLTSFCVRAGLPVTFGVIVRMSFMVVSILYLFFFSHFRYKRVCCVYLVVVAAYCFAFTLYYFIFSGFSVAFGNLNELIKIFYFPCILIVLFSLYQEHHFVLSDRSLTWTVALYMLIIFLAFITNSGFYSYQYGWGNNGWFYAANEIGAIVSMLAPIAIFYSIRLIFSPPEKNRVIAIMISAIILLLCCFCSTFIGTKVIFLGVVSFIACLFVWCIIHWFLKKEKAYLLQSALCICMCLIIGLSYLISPLRKNIEQVMLPRYEESTITNTSPSSSQKTELYAAADWILSNRLYYLVPIKQAFSESSAIQKMIGIGYKNLPGSTHDIERSIEMDLIALFFRHGIIGMLIFYLPIFAFLIYLLISFLRHFKKVFTSLSLCTYLYSFLLGIAISTLTGHSLVAPAVSIMIAITMVRLLREFDTLKQEK